MPWEIPSDNDEPAVHSRDGIRFRREEERRAQSPIENSWLYFSSPDGSLTRRRNGTDGSLARRYSNSSDTSVTTVIRILPPTPSLELNPSPIIPTHFENVPKTYPLPEHHTAVEKFQEILPYIENAITSIVPEADNRPRLAIRCLRRAKDVRRKQQPSLPVIIMVVITKEQASKKTWMDYEPQVRGLLLNAFDDEEKCPPIRYYIKAMPLIAQPRSRSTQGTQRGAHNRSTSLRTEFSEPGSESDGEFSGRVSTPGP